MRGFAFRDFAKRYSGMGGGGMVGKSSPFSSVVSGVGGGIFFGDAGVGGDGYSMVTSRVTVEPSQPH